MSEEDGVAFIFLRGKDCYENSVPDKEQQKDIFRWEVSNRGLLQSLYILTYRENLREKFIGHLF